MKDGLCQGSTVRSRRVKLPHDNSDRRLVPNISQIVHPIHSMFGSRVGFPAELRFLP